MLGSQEANLFLEQFYRRVEEEFLSFSFCRKHPAWATAGLTELFVVLFIYNASRTVYGYRVPNSTLLLLFSDQEVGRWAFPRAA
jgi:hypothetical protein